MDEVAGKRRASCMTGEKGDYERTSLWREIRLNRLTQLALASIGVAVAVLGLKLVAWWLTGSVALFSDAMESIVNVAAAAAAFLALHISSQPPDYNHPYGHHKAEYFSAVIEGALIMVAALIIFEEAYRSFQHPKVIHTPMLGLGVNAVASVVNGLWAYLLQREGRRARSPALIADAKHLFADVISSTGVIAGVILAVMTGWYMLDPILGALVAVNIVWSGSVLLRESVGGLMDEAAPPEIVETLKQVIATHGEGAIEAHDLRTRHAGQVIFIEFHLVVPGMMSVSEAHIICDRIEAKMRAAVPNVRVSIHLEPEHKAKLTGIGIL
jgi:cation diffusion facilitator family transporter